MKYTYVKDGKINTFTHESKNALISIVVSHLKKNNINFNRDDIAIAIARQCKVQNTKKVKITLADAVAGARALLSYTVGKSTSNAEILRRSSICAGCPMIGRIGGCSSCGAAGKMTRFANSVRSKKGSQIPIPTTVNKQFCGACNCSIALMVVTKIVCE